jgi:hypothetical protein
MQRTYTPIVLNPLISNIFNIQTFSNFSIFTYVHAISFLVSDDIVQQRRLRRMHLYIIKCFSNSSFWPHLIHILFSTDKLLKGNYICFISCQMFTTNTKAKGAIPPGGGGGDKGVPP